ncbi:hypothetical protein [Neoroseomonas lacus]|uniref:Uncharacterized protein n=1 Tax=Neoroseomonas lacus TaxID=287609 RepID=A0A917NLM9_9PROT|nr:hypothetical protein [Neoroseomonas lacus]GGJ09522.1 hypothetical protein GCM10011320_15660 [Neoroseomonas lacus]
MVAGIGVPDDGATSRMRGLAQSLASMVQEIELWIAQSVAPREQHAAILVIDAARLTLNCAGAAFKDLDGTRSDTPTLLRAWREDQAEIARRATRPD